ncbi:hypothetical protein BN2364_3768 [Alloalcanivorax xenomutans]|nr:hypothetical protein BN2364_3768 [Alloalcanivorax xenomutans]
MEGDSSGLCTRQPKLLVAGRHKPCQAGRSRPFRRWKGPAMITAPA